MKTLKPLMLILLISILFFQCSTEEEALIPEILSISPDTGVAHLPEFTLTVKGNHFERGAVILFDGMEKTAEFVSSTELRCRILPEDTYIEISENLRGKEKAAADLTVDVRVRNPNGEDSNTMNFGINANYTFGSPVKLFGSFSNCWVSPVIIDNQNNLHLLVTEVLDPNNYWVNIYHATSTDGGETWSAPVLILQNQSIWVGDIKVDEQGGIHLFYENYSNWEYSIYTLRKDGISGEWGEPTLLSLPDKGVWHYWMQNKQVALRGNKIFVFWIAFTKSFEEYLMFRASGDYGRTWTGQRRLKQLGQSYYGHPVITADGTLVLGYMGYFVKWRYKDQLYDVYSTRSFDNGDTWTDPVMISNGAGRSEGPFMVYSEKDNALHALYIWKQTGKINRMAMQRSRLFRKNKPEELLRFHPRESEADRSAESIPGVYHFLIRTTRNAGESWGDVKTLASFTEDDDFIGFDFDFIGDSAGNLNLMTYDFSPYTILAGGPKSEDLMFEASFIRSLNGGETWTEPVQITDIPEMWPNFISIDNTGRIYITLDTSTIENGNYYYTPYLIRSDH